MLKHQLAPTLTTIKTLATLADVDQVPAPLPITRHDEIGEMIGGFNHLLETLGKREEALWESEERNRTILQTAMDGFVLVDIQGRTETAVDLAFGVQDTGISMTEKQSIGLFCRFGDNNFNEHVE
jgi:hypothetical protein